MPRIRLAADDRQRYGLPEWIEYDQGRPRLSEIRALKAALDMTWTRFEALLGSEDVDEQLAGLAALLWLAVRRHTDVPWDDFDLDLLGADIEAVEDPNRSAPSGASTG
jgi:hypothetical protein